MASTARSVVLIKPAARAKARTAAARLPHTGRAGWQDLFTGKPLRAPYVLPPSFENILRPRLPGLQGLPGRHLGPGINALIQTSKPFRPSDRFQAASLLRSARIDARLARAARLAALTRREIGIAHERGKISGIEATHRLQEAGLLPVAQFVAPHGVGGFAANLLGQGVNAAIGFVPGLVMGAQHPVRFAQQLARQYEYSYGPLAHGNFGEFGHRLYEQPLGPVLDAATIATLGAGSAARLGLLHVPEERLLSPVVGAKGLVQPTASPNILTRAVQHAADRFSERHTGLPVVGAEARAARLIPHEAERALGRIQAGGVPFAIAERKLARNPLLRFAYDVLHRYGDQAAARIDQEIAMRAERFRSSSLGLVEKQRQAKQILALKAARRFVVKPPRVLREALAQGRLLADLGQEARVALKLISPEAAAERVHLPSRLVTGGEAVRIPAETPALARARSLVTSLEKEHATALARREAWTAKAVALERSKFKKLLVKRAAVPHTVESATAELDALQAAHEAFLRQAEHRLSSHPVAPEEARQLLAEHDAKIAQAQARVEALSTHVPTAPQEAALHAAQLRNLKRSLRGLVNARKQYADAVQMGRLRVPLDKRTTAMRNRERLRAQRKGFGGPPTLREELRAEVEAELERLSQKHSAHPAAQMYVARLERMRMLDEALGNISFKKLGAEKVTAADLRRLGSVPGVVGRPSFVPGRVSKSTIVNAKGLPVTVRHQKLVERKGAALSVARDRLARLEGLFVKRYGHVPPPGEKGGVRIVGGQPAGKGAAYVSDQPARPGGRLGTSGSPLKKRPVQGFQRQSTGALFVEGRARRSSRVVKEDWLRTARALGLHEQGKKAYGFSLPIDPAKGVLPGHVIFNPNGLTVPRAWLEADPLHELEVRTPRELAEASRKEYDAMMSRVFVEPGAGMSAELQQAIEQGLLRQMPKRIAVAFERGFYRPPPAVTPGGQALLDLIDLGNNVTRLGILYLKGSFVPANFAGNLLFLGIQQGVWAPLNLVKAARLLGGLSADTLRRVDEEVGSGAAISVSGFGEGPLGRLTRAIAHGSNVMADRLPRRAAWIHEAAKRGYKTDADITRLRQAALSGRGPGLRVANQISHQAEEAMVRFRGMSPLERRVVSRAIFIYPWMKGATRYGLRLPIDRPLQASLVARVGIQGWEDVHKELGNLVSYLQGIVPLGGVEHKLGTDLVPISNPASVTPLGTIGQVTQVFAGILSSKSVPSTFRVGSFLQPWMQGLIGAATHFNVGTGHEYRSDEGFREILYSELAGQFALENALKIAGRKRQSEPFSGSPASQRLYVQEGGWKDALKAIGLGGTRERLYNVPAGQAKAHAEQRASMDAVGRARDDVAQFRAALESAIKRTKLPVPVQVLPMIQSAVDALEARKLNRLAWAKANGKKGSLSAIDRFQADLTLLVKRGKVPSKQASQWLALAKRAAGTPLGDEKIGRALDALGRVYFRRQVLTIIGRGLAARGYRLAIPTP